MSDERNARLASVFSSRHDLHARIMKLALDFMEKGPSRPMDRYQIYCRPNTQHLKIDSH
jgi:hypothetical protein